MQSVGVKLKFNFTKWIMESKLDKTKIPNNMQIFAPNYFIGKNVLLKRC